MREQELNSVDFLLSPSAATLTNADHLKIGELGLFNNFLINDNFHRDKLSLASYQYTLANSDMSLIIYGIFNVIKKFRLIAK